MKLIDFISSFSKKNIFLQARLLSIFTIGFLLYSVAGYFSIKYMATKKLEEHISWVNKRVLDDLRYINGKWDTSIYNADPLTPHPAGAGGFNTPLYIITTDGFVIERTQLISGFLDTASLEDILRYTQPQTIETISNEKWRVLSKPINNNTQIMGGMLVSQYYAAGSPLDLTVIDQKLLTNLQLIQRGVNYTNNSLNISNIQIQDLNYELSYQIVDKNRVVLHKGRVPTYIEVDKIKSMIQAPTFFTVSDKNSGEQFRLKKAIYYDDQNNPKAIIVNGESLKSVYETLKSFILFSVAGFCIHLAISPLIIYILKRMFSEYFTSVDSKKIKTISFDPSNSRVTIDDSIIQIPHKSHQSHLLKILFSEPLKSRHQDELFQLMEVDNWRTLYDATLMVNKKCAIRLLTYAEKYFQINEEYLHNIVK